LFVLYFTGSRSAIKMSQLFPSRTRKLHGTLCSLARLFFIDLNPLCFLFNSWGTSGDWVFEGGVVTFADIVAAWTSVHGDGNCDSFNFFLIFMFVACCAICGHVFFRWH
jgi:hypothetical protein